MTVERPMFPPRADERCQIIQFSTAARVSPKRRKPIARAAGTSRMSRVELEQEPERPARDEGELTITCQNKRLRDARREVWREAETIREYWKARLEMEGAISRAQSHGLPEGNNHPPHNPDERWVLLANWRQAIVQQLLTPAPDTAAVGWKKVELARGQYEYTDIKTERIQCAIDDDVAFLAAHPTKKSKPMSAEAKERRRNFKEAMRRRIKEIAASRAIPDDEIRRVLSLRHRHIAEFATTYNVSFDWLLEGTGPIFK